MRSTQGRRMSGVRMSGVDTAWLRMEDPTNLMMITGVLICDESLDEERLRAVTERRLLRFDRFRQRVVQPPGVLARPRWVDDPHFELDDHLHRLRLPAPGGRAELEEAVSRLMSRPLDLAKPLWAFHLVENYAGGGALIVRLHHCLADGIVLLRVLLSLTDEEADAPTNGRAASEDAPAFRQIGRPDRRDGRAALKQIARGAGLAGLAGLAGRCLGAVGRLLLRAPDPPTASKGPLGVEKRAAWSAPVPLADVKAAGGAAGGTVNDLLLTAMTGALRRYLIGRGEPLARGLNVRAAVPVNLRPPEAPLAMGNRFGLVFLSLPVGLADPEARLRELKRRMDAMKRSVEAVVVLGLLELIGSVPPVVQRRIVDFLAKKVTAVATNVPGPRRPRNLAGARLRRIVPWVPQAGRVGLGLSIFSYDGEVTVGIVSDAGLVPRPDRLVAAFHEEFDRLQDRGRRTTDGCLGKGEWENG